MTPYRKSFGIWVPDRSLRDNRGFISPGVIGAVAGARRRTGGITYLASFDLDTGSKPAEFTDAGTPNWNDTAYINTGAGFSVSLNLDSSTDSTYVAFTGQADVWVYFIYKFSSRVTAHTIDYQIQDSGAAILLRTSIRTDGTIRVYNGTTFSAVTPAIGALNANTEYHWWLRYQGAISTSSMWVATSAAKPSSADAVVAGTATANAARIMFGAHGLTINTAFNKLRVAASEIGSNPT
jgi:hypothetical protein